MILFRRFLIVDPHYTGGEDINIIIDKVGKEKQSKLGFIYIEMPRIKHFLFNCGVYVKFV